MTNNFARSPLDWRSYTHHHAPNDYETIYHQLLTSRGILEDGVRAAQGARRNLGSNNGKATVSPPVTNMGLTNTQTNRTAPPAEPNTKSSPNEPPKNLRREMYMPIRRMNSNRLCLYYRDRALDVLKEKPREEGKRCEVCLKEFVPKEMVMATSCNHVFHEDCIVSWVTSNGRCPVCGFQI